jgi:hypothetical protein
MMLLAEIYEEVLLNKKMLLEDTFEIIQSIIIDLSRILYKRTLPFKSLIQCLSFASQFQLTFLEIFQQEGIVAGV